MLVRRDRARGDAKGGDGCREGQGDPEVVEDGLGNTGQWWEVAEVLYGFEEQRAAEHARVASHNRLQPAALVITEGVVVLQIGTGGRSAVAGIGGAVD